MKKFKVAIARTETTIYYFNVEAEHEGIAEEIAVDQYTDGEYVSKEVVWGEEDIHEITEIQGT
jgi:hypothetical protein